MSTYLAVLRTQKIKSWAAAQRTDAHNRRLQDTSHVREGTSPETHTRTYAFDQAGAISVTDQTVGDLVRGRLDDLGIEIPNGVAGGKESKVFAIEILLSASPGYFEEHAPDWHEGDPAGRLDPWLTSNLQFLWKRFGPGLVGMSLHLDESTPHIHAIVVPVVEKAAVKRGRPPKDPDKLAAWQAERAAAPKTWRLSARDVFGAEREALSALQDEYGAAMAPLGIERGRPRSPAKHKPPAVYRDELATAAAELEEQIPQAKEAALASIKQTAKAEDERLAAEKAKIAADRHEVARERGEIDKERQGLGAWRDRLLAAEQAALAEDKRVAAEIAERQEILRKQQADQARLRQDLDGERASITGEKAEIGEERAKIAVERTAIDRERTEIEREKAEIAQAKGGLEEDRRDIAFDRLLIKEQKDRIVADREEVAREKERIGQVAVETVAFRAGVEAWAAGDITRAQQDPESKKWRLWFRESLPDQEKLSLRAVIMPAWEKLGAWISNITAAIHRQAEKSIAALVTLAAIEQQAAKRVTPQLIETVAASFVDPEMVKAQAAKRVTDQMVREEIIGRITPDLVADVMYHGLTKKSEIHARVIGAPRKPPGGRDDGPGR